MFTSQNISGDTWLVTQTAESGDITGTYKVAVTPGGDGTDAIAVIEQAQAGPTPEEREAEMLAIRINAVKSECVRRIYAVVDAHAQINLASTSSARLLTDEQMNRYRAGLGWIVTMRANCASLIGDNEVDYLANVAWPGLPEGVEELAAEF